MSVTVKVDVGGSTRRFPLSARDTFADICGRCQLSTGGGLHFLYQDDEGDDITISTDADLQGAFMFASQSPHLQPLRLRLRRVGGSAADADGGGEPTPQVWPHLSKDLGDLKTHYPVLIVGSGYGGGISACRLAAMGQSVCVLERGKELWPGAYPNTMTEAIAEMQIRAPVLPGLLPQVGRKDGFLDFRIEEGVVAWIGCGLGGGSLVNSGVCIAPDTRVFSLPQWPKGLQADINTRLETGFTKARAMLQPAQYPDQATRPIPRVTRMQEAAAQLNSNGYPAAKTALADVNVSFRAHTNAAGVAQPACTLCGDCNTGCNVGAKNTVLMNYLPAAAKSGADIFCQVEVLYVEVKKGGGAAGEDLYAVHCAGTDPNGGHTAEFVVTTDLLILGAGTLGTTEILLRSKARGMAMSGQVVRLRLCAQHTSTALAHTTAQCLNRAV